MLKRFLKKIIRLETSLFKKIQLKKFKKFILVILTLLFLVVFTYFYIKLTTFVGINGETFYIAFVGFFFTVIEIFYHEEDKSSDNIITNTLLMGNSASSGSKNENYSPGSNTEEASQNISKNLTSSINKYPITAAADKRSLNEAKTKIFDQIAKGAFVGATITKGDPAACMRGAAAFAAIYAKDAGYDQFKESLNRGEPVEIRRERQWMEEETKKDE